MKKILNVIISGSVILSSFQFCGSSYIANASNYFLGDGTKDNPYQISCESDLQSLSELTRGGNSSYNSAYYIQTSDIKLSQSFIPIGCNENATFSGVYNGNYCSITDLSVSTDYSYNGLFGSIQSATIENLSVYGDVSSESADDTSATGGVVGKMSKNSIVAKCSFNGSVSTSSSSIGGLVGEVENGGSVLSSYSNATISGNNNVGGLIGYVTDAGLSSTYTISHNYVVGNVSSISNTDAIGGIIGNIDFSNESTSVISDTNLYLFTACQAGSVHSSKYTGCIQAAEGALKAWYDGLESPFIENTESNGFNDGYPIFEWQSTPYAFLGDGTADSPYQISSKSELEIMRDLINSPYSCGKYNGCYYIQTSDIDLENDTWEPIGKRVLNGEEALLSFNGNYNGQGHEITNLNVNRTEKFAGLFGSFNSDKFIENLIVSGTVNSTDNSVGGICGEICGGGGTIRNCAFYGDVISSKDAVGGIVGCAWQDANVENSYHNGKISGEQSVGGVVGQVTTGSEKEGTVSINNCYHVGSVTGSSGSSGGVVGLCSQYDSYPGNIYINNCYYLKGGASSGYSGTCTIDEISELTSNLLKNAALDLGPMFITNTDANYNDGYPILVFQTSDGLLGDANLDGSFNVEDVKMLQNWLLNAGELTCWQNVDFCKDEVINVFDLTLMKRYLNNIGGTSSGAPTSIKLNSSSYTMAVGQTYKLSATVIPETEANSKVSWISSDSSVASVDSNGNVKAIAPGTATITAKTSNGNKQASCKLTVLTPSIKLSSTSKSLYINDTATLTAAVTPEGSTVSWKSSDTKIVTVDGGKLKAIASGDATITATITVGGKEYSTTCKVNVAKAYVTLNKSSLSMYNGDTYTLTPTVSPSGTTLTWTSSNTSVATVSSSGKVTAVSAGSATITASFVYNGETFKATCSISVTKPTISLSAYSGSMYVGDSKTITASTNPSGYSVSWSSSNSGVASVSGGKITAKSAGSATITASFTYAGKTYSNSYSVSVSGLSLSLSSYSGSNNTDIYNFSFYDGVPGYRVSLPSASHSPSGGSVSWSMVSGNGYISSSSAMIMRQPGTCTARCTYTYNGYSVSKDFSYTLSAYKTTGGNNYIRTGPGGSYSSPGKVPAGVTVSISELYMNGDLNSGNLWGKVNYNGISGWIIISEW